MIPNKVIIWGIDNFNTLGLLRQLGEEANLFFLVLGKQTGCATSSKYCKEFVVTRTIEDGFVFLNNHFSCEAHKPVIITPGDEIIEFIDQHKAEFEERFIVPGTKVPGGLTKYDNKIQMAKLAEEVGMDVPLSKVCKWGVSLDDVVYPCILKPSHIKSGHKNEFKYKRVSNRQELEKALRLVRKDSVFLLQQFIPTEKEFVISGCRMMDGRIIISGTYTSIRYADDGNSSYATITDELPPMIDAAKIKQYLTKMDYYGLFGFEYGLSNGKAYFFEVNLRNDGTSQTFFRAGANRVLAWVYNAIGLDDTRICTTVQKPGSFMDELMDVVNVWHGNISRKIWRKQRDEATYLKYIDPCDMRPYEVMRRKKWRMLLQYAIVKKYRLYIVYMLDRIKLLKRNKD